jgi:lipoyl-dependent peroxiredoxin
MPMAQRSAQCTWKGNAVDGRGVVSGASGGLSDLPVTWASRTERSDGKTSPEELIAAAHSTCFSMALSHFLTQGGNPPEELEVTAEVTLDLIDDTPTVTRSALTVSGTVPGIDDEEFIKTATKAGEQCPISRALQSLEISVSASLG